MEAEAVNKRIGKKIRDLRHRMDLTQQELADRTELTKGYISQLEHGLVAPSVITLLDLIECLGSTPEEFFHEEEPEMVVFSEEAFFEKIDEAGNSIQWIVPTAQKNRMEPILVDMQPGGATEPEDPHEGEEFGYVLAGAIYLVLGERKLRVHKDESFYFKPDQTHYIQNAGKSKARVLWVSTPPNF